MVVKDMVTPRPELTLPLVEEFLAVKEKKEKRSARTLQIYRWFLLPFAENFPVLIWDQAEIGNFCIRISLKGGRSVMAIYTHFKTIRAFYNWLSRRYGYPKLDLTSCDTQLYYMKRRLAWLEKQFREKEANPDGS